MADEQLVIYTKEADGVATLTLNRPEKLNALNTALTQALVDGLRAADQAAHFENAERR